MHNFAVYGEFLYLRSRNAEIPYAVVQNSNVAPPTVPVQVSRLGVLDPDFEPAYRFGFTVSPGACSSFGVQYTMFESGTNDTLNSQTGFDVIPLIFHPTTITAATAGTAATARHNMSFDKIDADYRELLSYGPAHRVNYLVGASYANLEQQLSFNVANNSNGFASTDIDFDGAGLRFGLEAEHFRPTGGPMIYGKALTTILAGEFDTYYQQGNDNDPVQVETSWSGGRVVPVLDLELGFGYTCAGGLWRVTGGYQYSAWFNTVTTQEWIRGVQNNDFVSLSDTLTFDGLVGRIEGRF